jgi:hypothetical protein
MKYTWKNFSPTWEGMPFICHGNMMLSYGPFHCETTVLPPFKPNEFLYEKHGKEGMEKWEVFAEAVRDVMAKQGGLEKCDQKLSDKIMYKDFMCGKTDEFTINGETFTAKPIFAPRK